jgi:hypothetical protein
MRSCQLSSVSRAVHAATQVRFCYARHATMPREIFYAEHAQIHHAAMQVEIFYATMP